MAIKFSQFNLRTDHTSGMYLVGYDGNQNIHITVDNLFNDFINGTENTIAMFGTGGTVLADSILSQNVGATLLTVGGQLNVDAAATFDTSLTVTGDSTLNGNVILGNASADLITQTGTLYLNGPVKDTTNTLGVVDQVLLSDASGELTFTDLSGLHVGGAEVVEVPVKNTQGSALVKGDPVYISGSVGASGKLEVKLADASNTLKIPAVGLLKQDLANNAEGFAVVTGKLRNLITNPIDGVNPTENEVIYVKPSGTSGAALTTTKPVYGNFIQNIGKVGRVSTSNDGNLVVSSILRTNDIPNLTPGKLWVGSTGNTIESQTLFVDEANGRLGIGNDNSLLSTLSFPGANTSRIGWDGGSNTRAFIEYSRSGNQTSLSFGTAQNVNSSAERMRIDHLGNVGIGTTSPGQKLHVAGDIRVGNSTDTIYSNRFKALSNADVELRADNGYDLILNGSSGDNVGVGTTSPISKLHVVNGSSGQSYSNNVSGVLIDVNGTSNSYYGLQIGSSTGNNHLCVTNAGNVGIGTTSPAEKLDVDGNINIRGTASGVRGIRRSDNGYNLHLAGGSSLTSGSYIEVNGGSRGGVGNAFNGEINFVSGGSYQSSQSAVIGNYNFKTQWNGGSATLMHIDSSTGQVQFNEYGSGTFTGTVAKNLAVDSSGNIIENQANTRSVFVATSTDTTTNINATTTVNWNSESIKDTGFTHSNTTNPNEITITQAGTYKVYASITYTTAVQRPNVAIEILVNDVSTGARGAGGYVRSSAGHNDGTTIVEDYVTVSANDVVKIQTSQEANGGIVNLRSGESKLIIEKLTGLTLSTTDATTLNGLSSTDFVAVSGDAMTGGLTIDGDLGVKTLTISDSNSDISFSIGGAEKMRLDSSGAVGIGLTDPNGKLDVATTTNTDVFNLRIHNLTSPSPQSTGILFNTGYTSASRGKGGLIYHYDNTNYGWNRGDFHFLQNTGNTSATPTLSDSVLVIKNTGEVGIGTVSPSSKLQVDGAVQVADDTDTASASKVGALRYRTSGNNSYVDMCMQTGASTYAWVNIVENNW